MRRGLSGNGDLAVSPVLCAVEDDRVVLFSLRRMRS